MLLCPQLNRVALKGLECRVLMCTCTQKYMMSVQTCLCLGMEQVAWSYTTAVAKHDIVTALLTRLNCRAITQGGGR